MRITDKMLHNNLITNLSVSSERLYDAELKILTNKRLNKPSDNPIDVITALSIREKLGEIEQYKRNISRAQTLLSNTETVVSQTGEIYQKLNVLTIQGASDSYGANDKYSISYEVNQLLEQLVSFANNQSGSSYIFAGTRNDSPPYLAIRDDSGEIIEVKTYGSGGDINSIIGENIKMKVNVNGEALFESGVNLFDTLVNVRGKLRANDSDGVREQLDYIQEGLEKVINIQSVIGSRVNRINSAQARAESDVVNFSGFLSNIEDIDAAEAIMNYQMELITLQSSLQAGARLMQPKLSDFLR